MLHQTVAQALRSFFTIPTFYRLFFICTVYLCAFAYLIFIEYTIGYNKINLSLKNLRNTCLSTSRNVIKPISLPAASILFREAEEVHSVHRLFNDSIVTTSTQNLSGPKFALTLNRNYLLEYPFICSSADNLSVVIIIHTAPGNFIRRQTIRRTYGNATFFKPLGTLRLLFLLGRVTDQSLHDQILIEFRQHSDILQGDFIDAYRNLTHKGVMAYKWLNERCRNAKLILKVDDDVIINTFKLFTEYLPRFQEKNKSILCNHILPYTMPIIRYNKSKWYVHENEFKGMKYYPRYCSGFFVLITNDIIPNIYKSAFTTPFFWVDDVYLYGLLPSRVDGVTYTGLKKGTFTLSAGVALKCYRNTSRVCDYLVTGMGTTNHVAEIWKFMSDEYRRKVALNLPIL